MHYLTCLLASLCIGAISPTLADEPSQPSAAPISATSSAAATPTAPTASPAASDAHKTKALESQTKRLRAQGYRPKVRNDKTLFCRSEAELGSRFERERCVSAEDFDRTTEASKDAVADIQKKGYAFPNK